MKNWEKKMTIIKKIFKHMRPFAAIVKPLTSTVASMASGAIYLATAESVSFLTLLTVFFVVFLTSAFGFTINDYFDLEKDTAANLKHKVLVQKKMRPQTAFGFSLLLAVFSLMISAAVSIGVAMVNVLVVVLLSFYSYVNQKYGLLANLITALCTSLAIIIGMVAGSFNLLILFAAVAMFFFIVGREILYDIRDMEADIYIKKKSIPINRGVKQALIWIVVFFGVGTFITLVMGYIQDSLLFYLCSCGAFNLLFWLSVYPCLKDPYSEKAFHKFSGYSKLSFLLFLPGLLL